MIDSNDPIHRINNIKRVSNKIKRLLEEYMDDNRFMGWSKKKKKFVLKAFNNKRRYKKYGRRRAKSK